MAKLLIFLFCGLLSVTGCTVKQEQDNASASLMASGTTGELTWELGEDGTLTISGKGEMPDYILNYNDGTSLTPWYEYRDYITKAIIGDKVTSIGKGAFWRCANLAEIILQQKKAPPIFIYSDYAYEESRYFYKNCTVFVPTGLEPIYRSCSSDWSIFWKICEIDKPCTVIAGGIQLSSSNSERVLLFIWRLFNDGTLTINAEGGTGSIPSYNTFWAGHHATGGYEYAPWWYDDDDCRNFITSVIIEEGFEGIGDYAFYQCNNLVTVTLPSTIAAISNRATFSGCSNIEKIICHSVNPPKITYTSNEGAIDAFEEINKTECVLYVPAGSEEAYRTTDGWKDFVNIKEIQ